MWEGEGRGELKEEKGGRKEVSERKREMVTSERKGRKKE